MALRTVAIVLATVVALGVAHAQIELTTFQAGDPIVADEVNGNFDELATAIDAAAHGTADVTAMDLVKLDGFAGEEPIRSDDHSLGLPAAATSGCFGAHVRLPDGATVTSVSATMDLSLGTPADNDAFARFWHRTWTERGDETFALLQSFGSTTGYVTQTNSGPFADAAVHDVDAAGREYGVEVCLEEDAQFFHAQIAYRLP